MRKIISVLVLFLVWLPSFAEDKTSLNDLIQETVSKNPILLSLGHQITAQSAKAIWIKAKPDPFLTQASNTHKAPFRYDTLGEDPMNQVQFGLGQVFPFPGKLKLKGRIESSELEKIKQDYELAKLELISRLKKAYYNLFFTARSIEITEDIKKLLETLTGTVKAKYEVGNGSQQELLKVQLELSELLRQIEILRKDKETFVAEINSIVIRPQGTEINEVEEIQKQDFNYDVSDLLELSKEKYPLAIGQKARIEKSEYGIKLAKKEYLPDYSVEAGYGLRTSQFAPMYSIQLMSSLPLYYRTKQRKQVEEAKASLEAASESFRSIIVEAEKKVKELFIQIEKNNTLIDLLEKGIIPQARLALDASIAAYKVNKTDFLNVLDNVRLLLDFQTDYYQYLTDHEKAIAELEPLVGSAL